jgi:hypothetical protein
MGLMDLKKAELVALCEKHELDSEGTKAELVERLAPVVDWDDDEAEEEVVEEVVEEAVEEAVEPDYEHPELPTLADITDVEYDEEADIEVFIGAVFEEYCKREASEHELSHYRKAITFHETLTLENFVLGIKNSDEARSL